MTLGKWQSRDSNPGILAPEPKPELTHFPRDEEPHVTCPRSSDYEWSVLFLIISDWSGVVKSLAFLPKVFLASISVMGILWATQGAHLESSGFASMHIEKGIARAPKKEASAALGDLFFPAWGTVLSHQVPTAASVQPLLFSPGQNQNKAKQEVQREVVIRLALFPLDSWHLLRDWAQTCHDKYSPRLRLF